MCGDKCMWGGGGWVGCARRDKSLFDGAAVWMSLFVPVCWYREEGSGGKGHARGSHPVCVSVCMYLCVCVCVCVTLASLPELKELAPDSEHTDTTHYCAGIECYVKKLSWEDWRWEINELQLKERNKKENGIFFEKEMRKPEGKNVQMRCRWANRLNLKG